MTANIEIDGDRFATDKCGTAPRFPIDDLADARAEGARMPKPINFDEAAAIICAVPEYAWLNGPNVDATSKALSIAGKLTVLLREGLDASGKRPGSARRENIPHVEVADAWINYDDKCLWTEAPIPLAARKVDLDSLFARPIQKVKPSVDGNPAAIAGAELIWTALLFDGAALAVMIGQQHVQQEAGYRTGAAGRPTSLPLVLAELERRHEKGRTEQKVSAEAKTLHEWLSTVQPIAPRMTVRALENSIRSTFNRLKTEGLKARTTA